MGDHQAHPTSTQPPSPPTESWDVACIDAYWATLAALTPTNRERGSKKRRGCQISIQRGYYFGEMNQSRTRKEPSHMYATIVSPGLATSGFVEQFKAYVQRWISKQQSQAARAPAEPT